MSASPAPATAGSSRITVAATLLRLRSDEQLVAAFRQGQEAAFQVIHDRYKARLFAYARQMLGGSPQDAEDALQDVFLRAYSALRADARPVTLRAWLYRVAHNRCIDQMRRPAPVPVEASEDSPSDAPEPMVAVQQREDLRRLVTDIRALPQQQRSALLMREMDGMTYTELGAALGVTIPAVKSLLVRARMGLAETGEARDADCHEICADLAASHDRGVRSSGRARRHLRDCSGCSAYRVALKGTSTAIAALGPASPGLLAGLAQALGLGGAGSGALVAGAGSGGVASGSAALAVGATTTKVAAVLGAAAVAAGGVAEVEERMASPTPPAFERATAPPAVVPPVAGATTPDTVARAAEAEKERDTAERTEEREAERDEEEQDGNGEDDGDGGGATTPEQQLAQAPGGGGSGKSSPSGSSGGGESESAEGAVREVQRRGERLLDVPGRAVNGLLETLRRTTEPTSDGGSAQAERAGPQSSDTKGQAAGNEPGGEPERRPRAAG